MNNTEIEKMLQKLQLTYSALNPLTPDDIIVNMSERLAQLSKEIINYNTKKEKYVAIGYYGANIKINIRSFLSTPNDEILCINALIYEFISDFLLFAKNKDRNHFIYFFSKYMRNFENANGNEEATKFYNWIYNQYKQNYNFNYQQYITLVGEGSIFLVLHEFVHNQKGLLDNTIKLFHTPPTDKYFNDLNEDDTIEVACDFSALALIDKFGIIGKTTNCSKSELLEVFFIEIFSTRIYSTFHHFLNNNINNPKLKTSDILSSLIDITTKRFQHLSLALKVAQNSNLFFTDTNLSSVITNVNTIIQDYINCLIDFLQEDLLIKVKEYNSLPKETQQIYTDCHCKSVWKLFI